MNDVASTKQSVTAASGLVVLASQKATQRYWHADVTLAPVAVTPPTASFTSSVTSGTAPLPVQFTDTSSGSPTAWAWNFGDGSTATTQHPAHTYTAPGTYTVSLTATNAGGTSTPATATVSVTAAATATGVVTAGASSTAAATTAAAEVTVPRPAGVVDGTVLIAQITADGAPTMSTAPAGWTAVLPRTLALGTGARVFAYSHVVTDAATEPATYTWQLSAAQKWGAGITAFAGVDPVTPFDTATSTATDTTYAATSLTVPSVSTATDGAMLIGGLGLDNTTAGVTAPTAWTEAWESTGAQVAELAHRQTATAGPTGPVTWTLTRATAAGGWVAALRPATPSAPPPVLPAASFTVSTETGVAPLPVQFTDTSTGAPTTWAWDFGDGTTATTQHPSHTYPEPGRYTVTLTATNDVGSGTPATRTVTVTVTAPTAGATTTARSSSASRQVVLDRPGGVRNGDVLVARIVTDKASAVATVPNGWTAAPGNTSGVSVYYHLVTDAAREPVRYTWQLANPRKWEALMTAVTGVDPTDPGSAVAVAQRVWPAA
jgi:PKD repeat protein